MNAIILSGIWGVIMMFSGVFAKRKSTVHILAILGIVALLAVNLCEMNSGAFFSIDTRGMLGFDRFILLFNAIVHVCMLLFFLVSGRDLEQAGKDLGEYYALIFFILCGAAVAVSFQSLLMLFLGIEIISIPLYALTGIDKQNLKSNEASLKYFLMGAFSTGLMLMGIALVYGATGSFYMSEIAEAGQSLTPMLSAGLLLLLFSMAFKVSAAPFHFWTPDVYDGAPTAVTSFMATIVKVAAFVALIRLFQGCFSAIQGEWRTVVAIITAATLFIGNVTAVFQQSVKRMMAYSSISQAGFMLLAVVSLSGMAMEGLLYYAAAYSLATIGVFAVVAKMKDYTFDGFNGMGKHHPVLAGTVTVFMLSLAGIPATAGFMAKFYMLSAAIRDGHIFWLVILAIICAAISVYYYFRVLQAMYFRDGERQEIDKSGGLTFFLLVIAALLILLGIFPQWLIEKLYAFM